MVAALPLFDELFAADGYIRVYQDLTNQPPLLRRVGTDLIPLDGVEKPTNCLGRFSPVPCPAHAMIIVDDRPVER